MSANEFLPWVRREEPAPRALERRSFVQLLGVTGLVIAFGPGGARRLDAAERLLAGAADPWSPHVYLRIADDGVVTIICHRSEMGQGIRTTMPMIIADEMEADWAKCRVEQALGDPKYGSQNTDGSTSIRDFLGKYREAGATARALMEEAAAKEWNVPVSEVFARQHTVVHGPTNRTKTFGALVATARTVTMPAPASVRIKRPSERRWQGKKMPSIDLVPMTTGTAMYGADMTLPGMRVAVISRPPVWGGKVVSVDDSAALKVPGVERIIRIPETPIPGAFFPLGGVAVIAKNTWAALRGRDALKITWEAGPNGTHDSKAYKATLEASIRAPGKPGRTDGDVTAALGSATRKLSAEYHIPYLSHAQMEPVAAIARVTSDGKVEAWAPTQSPNDARNTIAQYLKVDAANVAVHVTLLGGAFGRKSKPDFICEAAFLSKEIGAPVRVQWSREDDLRNSYYHSVAAHRLEAALDASGKVTAWLHRSAYPTISATFAPNLPGPTPDELVNGASDVPWDVPNISVEVCPAVAHTRIGWYRSVNAIHHGFAIGSFVDELAHEAGKDPAAFLLELIGKDRVVDLSKNGLVGAPDNYYGAAWADFPLDTARARRVVESVKARSGWETPLPRGRGRGIAVHRSFLSYIAMVIEVDVRPDGTVLVPRATVAADAGFVANPDRARSQMEGAIIMAMSNTLYSGITFAEGRVEQSNYRDYQVTRMRAAPHTVDVEIIASEGLPGGIGEPGVPPAGAAIANAIFAATGVRVRELPVGRQLAGWETKATAEGAK
ncbi:MAG: molybdopterin-dependent oxidoreductase [Gemmatimonadetes bacterium]|nr:molybdopterin-dependent oxidoreductase [Gemmatimonadota bacterium]